MEHINNDKISCEINLRAFEDCDSRVGTRIMNRNPVFLVEKCFFLSDVLKITVSQISNDL